MVVSRARQQIPIGIMNVGELKASLKMSVVLVAQVALLFLMISRSRPAASFAVCFASLTTSKFYGIL